MNISIVIMTHHKRIVNAHSLHMKLNEMGFDEVYVSIDTNESEWLNGKSSWRYHKDSDWAVTLQDDAIILDTFKENLESALANIPEETCLSLYTGKVTPYHKEVSEAVEKANQSGASYLSSDNLLWGVGFAMKTEDIPVILDCVDVNKYRNLQYDNRIGMFFRERGKNIYYTNPSLVDHDYTLPSLVGHDKKEPRVAHNYVGNALVSNWNSNVIDMGV